MSSRERELLKKWVNGDFFLSVSIHNLLIKETKELLAQPEPEPATWQVRTTPSWKVSWTRWKDCSKEFYEDCIRAPLSHNWIYETRKLYTLPPKREPLSDEVIWNGIPSQGVPDYKR